MHDISYIIYKEQEELQRHVGFAIKLNSGLAQSNAAHLVKKIIETKMLLEHKRNDYEQQIQMLLTVQNLNNDLTEEISRLSNNNNYIQYVSQLQKQSNIYRDKVIYSSNAIVIINYENNICKTCSLEEMSLHYYSREDFEITEFYTSIICKLEYHSTSNKSNYQTPLKLNTNIRSFQIAFTVYNGQLNIICANMTNDINKKIEINKPKNWFTLSANIVKNTNCIYNNYCAVVSSLVMISPKLLNAPSLNIGNHTPDEKNNNIKIHSKGIAQHKSSFQLYNLWIIKIIY